MKNWFVSFLSGLALKLLEGLSVAAWDAFWRTVCDAVRDAERKWNGGTVKKKWVIDHVMQWLEGRERLGFLRRWAVRVFLNRVIDEIVDELNDRVGHDWGTCVADLKALLEGKIRWFRER